LLILEDSRRLLSRLFGQTSDGDKAPVRIEGIAAG
jgi:hypothetical protein